MTGSSLTERAHGTADERQGDPTKTLEHQIKRMESQFQLAMPKGIEAAQLVRDALTALRQTPDLAKCDAKSVLGGLMTCAQLGLRVGVLGQAWLLPFWDSRSKSHKAQLIIGYQGLADLAYRSDRIAGISARTVYENDPVFDIEYGTEDRLLHRPTTAGDRGEPIAYYCVAHIKGGRPIFYLMSHTDMEKYRDRFATSKKRDGTIVGPWRDNFEGMAQKTCLRQLAKWMPKSTEFATALDVDEGVRVDVTPTSSGPDVTHHYEQVVDKETGEIPPDDDTVPGEVVGDEQKAADQ